MSHPNSAIIAANLPLLLTTDEIEAPEEVVKDFLQTFDLNEIRQKISDISDIAICAPRDQLRGADRYDLLFIKRELIRLVEAVYLYHQDSNENKSSIYGKANG
jgi:hypothetical protein